MICLSFAARLALLVASPLVAAQEDSPSPPLSIAEVTADLTPLSSVLEVYPDPAKGKVWLLLEAPDPTGKCAEILYVSSLRSGLGSNPVGLDRGQLGREQVIAIRRLGNRVLFEAANLGFRALLGSEEEKRAVQESFAPSVIWGHATEIVEEDGRSLVDLTGFLLRDARGVARTLREGEHGDHRVDPERSAVDFSASLAFPDNLELEGVLTFVGEEPGSHVRATVPDPEAVTLVQHHSFIRLPDDGYTPREFDPRCGGFFVSFQDYSVPLTEPIHRHWVIRHRLRKEDPAAPASPPVEPIVYHVDPAAPEPVRGALVEGARWWNQAFTTAGYRDAFRVEILPPGAHPLDVRYNVIQWVHRSTRGWSYGGSVVDPRTGEIIKGHVSLGSLRVRQDRLLFEALTSADRSGTGAPDDPVELALARIRQLSAHEVGHTLGLAHNFAASSYADRASVMDYPAPRVTLNDGELDFRSAYGVGIGKWDERAIAYLYRDFPDSGAESLGLAELLRENEERGYTYLTDADARAPGSAHPLANLWDNGSDPVAELRSVLDVRAHALERFGRANLAPGQPLARLQEVFVPLYLYHRYQTEAAVRAVGGVEYAYGVGGAGQPARVVAAERQRAALAAVLVTLEPATLNVLEKIAGLFLPRPPAHGPHRELFRGATGPVFDRLEAARAAARLVLDLLLDEQRLARLVAQVARDDRALGLPELLDTLTAHCFGLRTVDPRQEGLVLMLQRVYADRLMDLASSASVTVSVRAAVEAELEEVEALVRNRSLRSEGRPKHESALLARDIRAHFEGRRRPEGARHQAPEPPPGSPIGSGWRESGCSLDR